MNKIPTAPRWLIYFFQSVGYFFFLILMKIFVRLEVVGKEKIKKVKGPIILSPNHTSELDVMILPATLPFSSYRQPIYFVTNPDNKFKTNFGWRSLIYGELFFAILGGYPVRSGFKDYSIALDLHKKLLENNETVVIFPEGKRTRDGLLNPAHGGMGYLAHKTSSTVFPIAIDSFFNISLSQFFLFKRKVTITVCDPIPPRDFNFSQNPTVEEYHEAGEKVLGEIKKVINH